MKTFLARRAFFSSARQLRVPDWSDEQNRAAFGRDTLPHGHDYSLNVYYEGEIDPHDGMIVNLSDLKPVIAAATEPLDGKFLDREVAHFQQFRPTCENLVNFLWDHLPPRMGAGILSRVCLEESAKLRVQKIRLDEHNTQMKLTRSYEFAAAHRLHVPSMPDEENSALYGKCNNAQGHGHNYGLEVTIEGEPDAQTGAIMSGVELDKLVDEEVFERFDHKHLNEDCPEFKSLVPTSENLARVIFEILQKRIDATGRRLSKIGLHETQKNYFEVEA
jgi:6-pyruvoyltetrahydropterin/6-carboxytetrahydropterin synthase